MSSRWLLGVALLWYGAAGLILPVWADAYTEGVAAYQARNYTRANQLMQAALQKNPRHAEALFYLGMGQVHVNNLTAARQAFELVIQMVPPEHALAAKARNNINYITKQQITLASNSGKAAHILTTSLSRNSKDNYLTHVIPNGKVVHFDRARMPLRVYISSGAKVPGWRTEMRQVVTFAMRAWQRATRGQVAFVLTAQEAGADIIVHWQRHFSDGILGVSPLQTVGDTIVRSDMTLAVYYPDGQAPIPMADLQAIAVHELGHAIGLRGHSPYPDDIMYFSKTRSQATLSARDVHTVGMLYKLEADIQNHAGLSTAMTKQYYTLYEQGYQAQVNNRPAEAMRYYRQCLKISRALPEAMFNLGALLINEGNRLVSQNRLAEARRYFSEATSLYTALLRQPKPPPAARENLEIAQNNLSALDRHAQAGHP